MPAPDDQRGDIWFRRTRFPVAVPYHLRIFDRLFPGDAMLEAFAKAVDLFGLWSCQRKQLNHFGVVSKRDPRVREPVPMWILSAGRPEQVLERYPLRRRNDLVRGCYELGEVRLLVLSELPPGRETLVLRLMGSGRVLREAMEELRAAPPEDAETSGLLRFVACLRRLVNNDRDIGIEEKGEFIMTSAWAEFEQYEQQLRQEGADQGRKEGREEALREAIQVLCEVLDIPMGEERRAHLEQLGLLELNALHMRLRRDRAWPG